MSVGNISFILMKSSFTIYKDIQTANRKYTQTHVNEVLEGFTVTKYREKLLVITQFRTHVWFCSAQYWGQGAREGRQGWARVGAYRGWCPLSGSSFSEYRSTDYSILPPSLTLYPPPHCWCLHVQQLATRNLQQRERASLVQWQKLLYSPPQITWKTINKAPQ